MNSNILEQAMSQSDINNATFNNQNIPTSNPYSMQQATMMQNPVPDLSMFPNQQPPYNQIIPQIQQQQSPSPPEPQLLYPSKSPYRMEAMSENTRTASESEDESSDEETTTYTRKNRGRSRSPSPRSRSPSPSRRGGRKKVTAPCKRKGKNMDQLQKTVKKTKKKPNGRKKSATRKPRRIPIKKFNIIDPNTNQPYEDTVVNCNIEPGNQDVRQRLIQLKDSNEQIEVSSKELATFLLSQLK